VPLNYLLSLRRNLFRKEDFSKSFFISFTEETMDFPCLCCGAVAFLFFIVLCTKMSRARTRSHTNQPLPPLVNGIALLTQLPNLLTKGLPAVVSDLYDKYGSVFRVCPFCFNVTVLIGPEVTAHFFQCLDS
jgi:hypothetical protein